MKTKEKGNQATCSDATIYHGNTKNILTFLLLLHFDIMYICVLFTGCPVILARSADLSYYISKSGIEFGALGICRFSFVISISSLIYIVLTTFVCRLIFAIICCRSPGVYKLAKKTHFLRYYLYNRITSIDCK